MKLLLTTIAAVLVVGCGPQPPDISIHMAAIDGNIEAVKQHLATGTDVNAEDAAGTTPLHRAAGQGHKGIAELLIAAGADVNAKSDNGRTPLDGAEYVNEDHHSPEDKAAKKEIADLLRKHGGKTGEELK
jgi:hypothetical protein